jgi:G patch domain-containing protein 1
MSQKDRERIQAAAASAQVPSQKVPVDAAPPEPLPEVPFTPANVAAAALKGFMPFTSDPAKQARYVAYLRSQADGTPAPAALPGQSSTEHRKELSDYAKSAVVFKPVTGAMAGRFTSAAVIDTGPNVVEGLYQPTHAPDDEMAERARVEDAVKRDAERERHRRDEEEAVEGSRAHAVKFGMYGALTRELTPWQPARLLCKRFGVKDPNPEVVVNTPVPGAPNDNSVGGGWEPEQALKEAGLSAVAGASSGASAVSASSSAGGRRDLDNVGLGEDDDQGRDTLTYVRPAMDVFKAIFASDDEDSDHEDEGQDAGGSVMPVTTPTPTAGPSQPSPPASAHAPADDIDMAAYDPKPHIEANKPVDLTTFKPIFISRSTKDGDKGAGKSKKKNRDRKAKAIVSFADEDEGGLQIAPTKGKGHDGERTKKRRKEGKVKEDATAEEGVWVEKPPPEILKMIEAGIARGGSADALPGATMVESGSGHLGPRARKRAIDFM